jgi:hypothetical protein
VYFSETMCQRLAVADVLNSQAINNTTATTLGVDMSKFKRVQYLVSLSSSVAGTGTLDGRLQGSANANFTGNTNITGTNMTQLTVNNTITRVEIRADQLAQANNAYRYVRLQLTGAVNSATASVIGLATDSEQNPASQYNLNSTFLAADVLCTL